MSRLTLASFRLCLLVGCCWLCSGCGPAEPETPAGGAGGLAVLAQEAPGFAQARPGRPLVFPRDHGAHPDYRIEWWYLTANLEDADGRPYGAQWTLFRFATEPPADPGAAGEQAEHNPWQSRQVYMAHMAITTPEAHVAFQRYARGGNHGGVQQAGATAAPFAAWLDDWRLQSSGPDWLPLDVFARQGVYALQLRLQSDRAPVLQGDRGFSAKNPQGTGSYYYRQPFLQASGELVLGDEVVRVTGQAWLDREWSSQFLQADQSGWDWFSLHLDSGEKLMLFRLRARGAGQDFLHAVLIDPSGEKRELDPSGVSMDVLDSDTVAGRTLPMRWRIGLRDVGRSFVVEALHSDQWLDVDFPYWEGAVQVGGTEPGQRGRGYMELTGY